MAEKSGEFLKKTRTVIAGFGSKAGKALQDVKEQTAPITEKVSVQVKSTSKKAADAVECRIKDVKAAAEQKKEKPRPGSATKEEAASETGAFPVIKPIATRSAIKIIYYLMSADGEVLHSEEEKFDAIGAELDPNFAENKE